MTSKLKKATASKPKAMKQLPKAKTSKAEVISPVINKPNPDNSKQGKLIAMLQCPAGATLDEMVKATGWQRHSLRGTISGALKKRLGLLIISQQEERGRVYRIQAA